MCNNAANTLIVTFMFHVMVRLFYTYDLNIFPGLIGRRKWSLITENYASHVGQLRSYSTNSVFNQRLYSNFAVGQINASTYTVNYCHAPLAITLILTAQLY